MKLAVKKDDFCLEKFTEVSNKFEYADSMFYEHDKYVVVHEEALSLLGDYIGIEDLSNDMFLEDMIIDKDVLDIVGMKNNMYPRRYLRLHIGDLMFSIVQGYFAYTNSNNEYEIAILNNVGMITPEQFKMLDLPEDVPRGDYSRYDLDGDPASIGAEVIGYLPFEDLKKYIIALITIKHTDVSFTVDESITPDLEF